PFTIRSASRSVYNYSVTAANQRVISSFLDYLKVEKGLAALTVSAYHADLVQFAEFLEARRRDLLQARRDDVRAFLSQLFANAVKDRSVARKLSALRHLYKYVLVGPLVKQHPTVEIFPPRQWKILPKSLAMREIDAMLKAVDQHGDSRTAAAIAQRDRAMLEVLYAAG